MGVFCPCDPVDVLDPGDTVWLVDGFGILNAKVVNMAVFVRVVVDNSSAGRDGLAYVENCCSDTI